MQVISRLIPCMEPTITADSSMDSGADAVMNRARSRAAPPPARKIRAESRRTLEMTFS